ncbi:MAG: hypothetical protein HKN26_12520, partial [Acidimicrobiales bacterium]|nr:hypothetical protein [Acidimicrobiales bacterium]
MTALLSLIGALVVGGSDFAGGYAARQTSPFRVTVWVQAISLMGLVVGGLFVAAPSVRTTDIVAGLVGGAAATFSFAALYRSFSEGQISLLAPTAAISSGVLPVFVGLVRGESISLVNWVGVIVAFAAIALVSQSKAKLGEPD